MLNSLRPYPCQVTSGDDGTDYEFTTAGGTKFIVYFTSEVDFFEGADFNDLVVTIGFRPQAGRVTRPGFRVPASDDPQLFTTIAWVIESYLMQHPQRLVVWVCSTADNQEAARLALFDRKWRLLSRYATLLLRKVNLELAPREFMSIVYRADSPFRAELEALLPEGVNG